MLAPDGYTCYIVEIFLLRYIKGLVAAKLSHATEVGVGVSLVLRTIKNLTQRLCQALKI